MVSQRVDYNLITEKKGDVFTHFESPLRLWCSLRFFMVYFRSVMEFRLGTVGCGLIMYGGRRGCRVLALVSSEKVRLPAVESGGTPYICTERIETPDTVMCHPQDTRREQVNSCPPQC